MGWNGSGLVSPLWTWVVDKATYPNLTASRFDTFEADICSAIQNCMAKDGQNAASAALSMGGFKLTNLANGTVSTDAVNFGQLSGVGVLPATYLLNGNFRWWQRHGWTGSITVTPGAAGGYIADRWYGIRDGVETGYSFTQRNSLTLSHPSATGIKIQRVAGNASVTPIRLGQSLDPDDIKQLKADAYVAHGGSTAGRYIIFSCWATKGANAGAAGYLRLELLGNNTANANIGTTGGWVSIGYNDNAVSGLSTTVAALKYGGVLTTSLALTYNSYAVRIEYIPAAGAAGADDSLTITCCRLTFGSVVPPPQTAYEEDPGELARLMKYCQRGGGGAYNAYFLDSVPGPGANPAGNYPAVSQSSDSLTFTIPFATPLRCSPYTFNCYRSSFTGGSGEFDWFKPGVGFTNCTPGVSGAGCSTSYTIDGGTTGTIGQYAYTAHCSWLADAEFY